MSKTVRNPIWHLQIFKNGEKGESSRAERPQSFFEDIKKALESVASVEAVGELASGEEAVYRSFIYSGYFEHRSGNALNLKPFGEWLRMAANARLRLFSHILRYC